MVDKKNFYIPQIEEEEKESKVVENKPKEKDRYIPDQFVSPISGRNVKDEVSFPSVSYNNGGKQYDSFRDDDKKQRNDYSDYIIKTESSYSNAQTRNAYGGNNPIYKAFLNLVLMRSQ